MPDTQIRWIASETESIEPFAISRTALDATAIRFRKADRFRTADTYFVETQEFWDDFDPEIRLDLNRAEFESETGLNVDDLLVSLILRDRVLNRFTNVMDWPLATLPDDPVSISSSWASFSHSDRIDVCVVATPIETMDRGPGIARNRADVVCRRIFKIRGTAQATKIPYRWAKPEEFEARNVPSDTIWMINWLGEDLERPISDNVEIWLNERHKDKFLMFEGEQFGNLFRREMAAGIFLELAMRVLADLQPPREEGGMRWMIYDLISRVSELETEDLITRMDHPDGLGFVHAWTQYYVGLNDAILKL